MPRSFRQVCFQVLQIGGAAWPRALRRALRRLAQGIGVSAQAFSSCSISRKRVRSSRAASDQLRGFAAGLFAQLSASCCCCWRAAAVRSPACAACSAAAAALVAARAGDARGPGRHSMRSIRSKAASAPRWRSSSPASWAADARLPAERSRGFAREASILQSQLELLHLGCWCSASSRAASSRFCSMQLLLLRCAHPCCARSPGSSPAGGVRARWTSDSIWRSAALWLALSRSASRRSSLLTVELRGQFVERCASAAALVSAWPSSRSTASSFCCVSRSSRFSASGPSRAACRR